MNLGIIGLPQAGKKTVFEILTGQDPARAQSRGQIRYGIAPVRDPRVDRLTEMYRPRKSRYAEFEISLPPDIRPEATKGAEWLDPLRNVDALLHVVRTFESDTAFHILGDVDPARDVGTVDAELLLADLELVETRLERIGKEGHRPGAAEREQQKVQLDRCRDHLEAEQPLRTLSFTEEEMKAVRSLQFLTMKPLMVAFNVSEYAAAAEAEFASLAERVRRQQAEIVFLSAAIESELTELDGDAQSVFMEHLGIAEPAAHRLSRAAFECLGLLSFFTVGEDEVRAWAVRRGATAPEAAGRIHSDLERGFIRAETITYDDLIGAGDEKAAHRANLYKLNGKAYVVRDGDTMCIRFSV